MNIITNVIESFFSQGILGLLIICIIFYMCIFRGFNKGSNIKAKYTELLNEFNTNNTDENNNMIFKSNEINLIVEDFKKSAERGTENINTEVIIQKRIGTKITDAERSLKILPAISIALGLLGTFGGLVSAISSTNEILQTSNMETMNQFAHNMSIPIKSMSSAFWTSIAGVISSILINLVIVNVENIKENFYDQMEDYLDNVLYSQKAKNFTNQFSEFNSIIKDSMLQLAGEMRSLFEDGVKELVGKINSQTLDLSNYAKDLDRLTKSLNKSVENFKNPVDKFKNSVYEFSSMSEDFTDTVQNSVSTFTLKVDLLDKNLSNLYDIVEANKSEIKSIGNILKSEADQLTNTYKLVTSMVENSSEAEKKAIGQFENQVINLNKGYENFNSGLQQFTEHMNNLKDEIGSGISKTLKSEMGNLTENIVDKLSISMKEVASVTEQLAKTSKDLGMLMKQTNDFYASTVKDSMNEVGVHEDKN